MTTPIEAKSAADKERIYLLAMKLLESISDNGDTSALVITHAIAAVIVNLHRGGMKRTDQPDMEQAALMAKRVLEVVCCSDLMFKRSREAFES